VSGRQEPEPPSLGSFVALVIIVALVVVILLNVTKGS